MKGETTRVPAGRGLLALSPMAVFLLLYVAVSIAIGDFYKMPISVALVISSAWAVISYRGKSVADRIETFSRAAGNSNILYMVWIFVLAGAFAALAKEIGAVDATVGLALRFCPPDFVVPTLFLAACFISLAVGTSVGTIVALAPLAQEIAVMSNGNVAFYVAVVLGGAFFGDNLSFISDTTIAATRSQGCEMADKFKANFRIVLPAAIVTVILYAFLGSDVDIAIPESTRSPWLVLPYIVVILTALLRMNVTIVLTLGILVSLGLGLIFGNGIFDMAGHIGSGIDSMGNLIIITLLAAGMLEVIKRCGGIKWLLQVLTAYVSGTRGGQVCIALLVSLVNICTANNTVAIITVGSLAKEIAQKFGITPQRSASLLDTCSCVVQCLIPYGAQTLLATSLGGVSPAAPFPYLYYPFILAGTVAVSILLSKKRRQ